VVQLILTRNVKLVHRRTASRARLSKDLIAAATRQAVDLFQGYRRGSKGEHSRGKLFAAIMNGGLYWQTFVHDMTITPTLSAAPIHLRTRPQVRE
jgi:hypothetical protein